MPRLKGFGGEDYTLAQDIDQALGLELGTAIPSRVCNAAEKWVLYKLRTEASNQRRLGYHDSAAALVNFADKLEKGIH